MRPGEAGPAIALVEQLPELRTLTVGWPAELERDTVEAMLALPQLTRIELIATVDGTSAVQATFTRAEPSHAWSLRAQPTNGDASWRELAWVLPRDVLDGAEIVSSE